MTPEAGAASPQAQGARLWTVPNALSVLRLPLAAAFVALDGVWARTTVLTIGALTDALDGWLARHRRQTTGTGAVLDAVFDKLFVLTILLTFWFEGRLGLPALLVLLARDLYTGLGFLASAFAGWRIPVRARLGGKVVTVLQLATLYVLLWAPARAGAWVFAVAVASAYAIVDYTVAGRRALRSSA